MNYAKFLSFFISFWCLNCASARMAFCQEGEGGGNFHTTDKTNTTSETNKLEKLLELAEKDISQLSQVRVGGLTGSPSLDSPVSTVTREESTVGQSPWAVYVVTPEMIRRSGAKNIPDLLRLVPGVIVQRIDSNKWAISIRGFAELLADKLLVQIDGRSVYNPVAGVWWDLQDVLLEDVERIEVIRGPGGSIWGTNAVNGVINIVTKNAKETQGTYFESGAGTEELGFASLRYGGRCGEDLHYRIYGKWFERGSGWAPNDQAFDDWRQARSGFRVDWKASPDDHVTIQGDYYNGYDGDHSIFPQLTSPYYQDLHDQIHVEGQNVLVNWRRVLAEDSDWTMWTYYDRNVRQAPTYGFGQEWETFDYDFQHRFPLGERHNFIWGFGYRNYRDVAKNNPPLIEFTPAADSYNLFSCFAQDRITLQPDLWYLTIGSKFEYHDFTKFDYQPTVRVLWTPNQRVSLWGAVSRAIHIPTRGERYGNALLQSVGFWPFPPLPIFPFYHGNPHLEPEELIAYELGMRAQATEKFYWDATIFLNEYEKTYISHTGVPYLGPGPAIYVPAILGNHLSGPVYGFELAANYTIRPNWRLQGAYSFLVMEINSDATNNQNPRNQFNLLTSWDLGRYWEFDLIGRYVDSLPQYDVPSYFVGDARLCWKPRKTFELSLVGRNLLKSAHPESGNADLLGTQHTEVESEVYGQITLRR